MDTLLENAVVYAGNKPAEVMISTQLTGELLCVSVRDCGIGIHKDDLVRVMEPFARGRNVGGVAGSGAGLYLVQKMLRRCGGQVKILSEYGQFTEVKLLLPCVDI